jgi:hypothetical protein
MSTSSGDDFKRTQKLLGEFLGRPSSVEVLRIDERKGSNLEVGSWFASSIGRGLVKLLSLGDGSAKFLM